MAHVPCGMHGSMPVATTGSSSNSSTASRSSIWSVLSWARIIATEGWCLTHACICKATHSPAREEAMLDDCMGVYGELVLAYFLTCCG